MNSMVRIDSSDNCATCLVAVRAGERVSCDGVEVTAREEIPRFHKIALTRIAKGESCIKYGEPIGTMTSDVEPGGWVHVHNLASARGRGDIAGGEGR